jgi:hypothetical protein
MMAHESYLCVVSRLKRSRVRRKRAGRVEEEKGGVFLIQRQRTDTGEWLESERGCPCCKKIQPLLAFSRQKGERSGTGKICRACEQRTYDERHARVTAQRERWHHPDREEKRQSQWERRVALRQAYEEQEHEHEQWYQQQSDRSCRMCRQVLPASAFGWYASRNGFTLYTRCKICHEAMLEQRSLPCCVCHRRTSRHHFLTQWKGYALCGNGAALSLCCCACEAAFLALSDAQQSLAIRSCCQRAFPAGQVIYAEVDPETRERRYIGRTGKPKRRHVQHLSDRSPQESQWGPGRIPWYTRRNWMQALTEKALTPSMEILLKVEIAPHILEWEQRFIFHGIQHGWNLLNWETMDKDLVTHIRTASVDFFTSPFEYLVQKRFFSPYGLIAFLHRCYQPGIGEKE